jgi:hypothetical protein
MKDGGGFGQLTKFNIIKKPRIVQSLVKSTNKLGFFCTFGFDFIFKIGLLRKNFFFFRA